VKAKGEIDRSGDQPARPSSSASWRASQLPRLAEQAWDRGR
jgi:hypothetical protein